MSEAISSNRPKQRTDGTASQSDLFRLADGWHHILGPAVHAHVDRMDHAQEGAGLLLLPPSSLAAILLTNGGGRRRADQD